MNIVEIANKASKIPGVKWLLKPFYYRYKKYKEDRVIANFKRNGMSTFAEFDHILTQNGYPYFLIFGSMLGAVREHGLIKHDLDMDTAMWFEDCDDKLLNLLTDAGFKLTHSFEVDNGKSAREWTFEKNGISIDIFFVYPAIDKYPYCCDFPFSTETTGCVSWNQLMKKLGGIPPRRVEHPFTKDIVRVKFENMVLPILANSDEILKRHYGKDYMTPIAHWTRDVTTEPPTHLVMWSGKLAEYKEFH